MGTHSEPTGHDLGVVGMSGLGEQYWGAQTGPGPKGAVWAEALGRIKDYLCSRVSFGKKAGFTASA